MNPVLTSCPICSTHSNTLGLIVHNQPATVAGVPIDLGDIEYSMHHCPQCALEFKSPSIPMDSLIDCYTKASGDHWEHDPSPRKRRFDDLASCISKHSNGKRILDIGCANGALLAYMLEQDPQWNCFGLEPGEAAAETASKRGVKILGALLDDLDPENPEHQFDVIIAIDVLEHLLEPDAFFNQVAQHLAPKGIFVALTGDHGAWGWRLQAQRYWYCNLPEHQVFYCEQTIEHLAKQNDLKLIDYQRVSHMRSKPSQIIRDFVRNTLWGVSWRLKGFGFPPLRRKLETQPPPGWLPNKDHMLFVVQSQR